MLRTVLKQFRRKSFIAGAAIAGVLVYGIIILCGCFCADSMIFHPPVPGYTDSPDVIKIQTKSGQSISAVYLENSPAEYTILYSHGNAEDLGSILPVLKMYHQRGFSVLGYDYRGYGTSQGKATVDNTYEDIEAVYDYAVNTLGTEPGRIILLGRSVGGGPSVHLAVEKPVAGLILEGAFVSAFRVVTRVPLLPFDRFRNIDKIRHIRCPVLFIHGRDDHIVRFWHGGKLFAAANEPKMCYWVDGAGHNDIIPVAGDRYWQELEKFTALVKKQRNSLPFVKSELKHLDPEMFELHRKMWNPD